MGLMWRSILINEFFDSYNVLIIGMRGLFLFTGLILCCAISFSQKVLSNTFLFDIDVSYNEVDTVLLNNNKFTVNAYRCNKSDGSKESCVLYSQKTYDRSGRLIDWIKGDNLKENKVDFIVRFKKISDLVFEATVKYPPDSKMIPHDFYVDTVIKESPKRICLYKSDRNKYIVVKSVYTLDINSNLIDIKRYDTGNNLVHIYYPFGNRKPKKEWSDVSVSKQDSTVINYILYEENEFISYYVYNKKGKITETKEINNTFNNGDSSLLRKIIIYDSDDQPIIRTTVDETNQLISEERFYYRGKNLVRYTEDGNVNDSILQDEKYFNELGKLVLYKSYNEYSGSLTIWKFYYDDIGLLKEEEYFLDGILKLTRKYSYE